MRYLVGIDNGGTFSKAAVFDEEGNQVSEETYEDIVLYADGTHKKDGLMIAKQEGVYRFYKDGETFGEYEDADIVTADGMVALHPFEALVLAMQ